MQDLKNKVEKAKQQIKVGGRYVHFKDPKKIYVVRDLAILESTEEVVVTYQAEYGDRLTFVRTASSWLEKINKDGKQVPRFTLVNS